jgi:hypothetical protein
VTVFDRAVGSLVDTRGLLDGLGETRDAQRYRELFNAFLGATRAVTDALQKEGERVTGFDAWYAGKEAEMREDELLRFLHEAGVADFHRGEHQLSFDRADVELVTTDQDDAAQSGDGLQVGADGAYWVVDAGTPQERLVPMPGTYRVRVGLQDAPRTHLGQNLTDVSPTAICALALTYFEDLVRQARTAFGEP